MFPFAPVTFALLSERGSPRIPVPHAGYNFNNTHSEAPNSTTSSSPTSNYTLVDLYNSQNFFSEFDFFNSSDPTHGFVKYVDYQTANNTGLIGYVPDGVMLGVDAINNISATVSPQNPGRPSVRVTSKKAYTEGLFIADVYHMPSGLYDHGHDDGNKKSSHDDASSKEKDDKASSSCGLWPAFWTVGPNWPASGEIDILEGVNTQSNNSITLHSAGTAGNGKKSKDEGGSCNISSTGSASDTKLTEQNCASDTGCKQDTTGGYSSTDKAQKQGQKGTGNYGVRFNKGRGGVYAVEWLTTSTTTTTTSSSSGKSKREGDKGRKGGKSTGFIKVWFFPRGTDLATKLAGNTTTTTITNGGVVHAPVDPSNFGTPLAAFVFDKGCSLRDRFKDHSIVFNTAFCGDWAGKVWDENEVCKKKATKCEEYVANNPESFKEAYWVVNSIKVYQLRRK